MADEAIAGRECSSVQIKERRGKRENDMEKMPDRVQEETGQAGRLDYFNYSIIGCSSRNIVDLTDVLPDGWKIGNCLEVMRMKGYKIYLTKSREVAEIIYYAMKSDIGKFNIACVRLGCAYGLDPELLPELYRTTDYSYCLVEYDLDHPKYEIIFA